ncbi:MAG: hypothetical protein LBU97_02250 [Alistipes sp.]|jgi:hypothetical protein|nr:hypothetical protein [Alistipes sp.]
MKTLKIFLTTLFVLTLHYSNAQEWKVVPEFTKENCIALVRDNYLFQYFRNPTDTLANLDRFVETVNKIVPIGTEKKESLKEQLLISVNQQTDKLDVNSQIRNTLSPTWGYVPLLGGRADDVLLANFTEAEYQLIFDVTSWEKWSASYASSELRIMQKKESPRPLTRAAGERLPKDYQTRTLNSMFDYFDIE